MQLSSKMGVVLEANSVIKKWSRPSDGWFTINCDASGVVNVRIGIGCVIRDSQGCFVGARCCTVDGRWQIREAIV